jgi:tRNA(Ile)-lysidine synthetase-like protein
VIVDPAQRLIELLSAIATNASPRAAKLSVAFSGGVDSMFLLAALARSRRRFARVRALHVNHHLLPEADEWAVFCREAARTLRVSCDVLHARGSPSQGESREEWARGARYAALSKVVEPGELLVTAHHANDQAETLLLQLLRGAGVAGLAGMPAIAPLGRAWIARPMLALTRAEIEAAARDAGLCWIEDSSNADEKIARNYLRRRVLPAIAERWPAAVSVLSRSAQHLADARKLLDEQAAADLALAADGIGLSATALRKLPLLRRKNLLRHCQVRCAAERRLAGRAGLACARALRVDFDRCGSKVTRADRDACRKTQQSSDRLAMEQISIISDAAGGPVVHTRSARTHRFGSIARRPAMAAPRGWRAHSARGSRQPLP